MAATLGRTATDEPALRHNALIDAESRRIAEGQFDGPVIVAGSTGTRPSTARLIAAISVYQKGAVVLPGLDQQMATNHWALLADLIQPKQRQFEVSVGGLVSVTVRSHPQYSLLRLVEHLGLQTGDITSVISLGTPVGPIEVRNRLVSLALLPSLVCTVWSDQSRLAGRTGN